MQMVLKCADIGHLAAAPKTHRRWAYQLEEEFFRQVQQPVKACMTPFHEGDKPQKRHSTASPGSDSMLLFLGDFNRSSFICLGHQQ